MHVGGLIEIKKAVIIYESIHHKNTEKVINYVSEQLPVKILKLQDVSTLELKEFDLIILASGIYFSGLHAEIIKWLKSTNIKDIEIGIIYTCGFRYMDYSKKIRKYIIDNGAIYIGSCWCRGYDTYGFLSKIGGIAKNHPNNQDLNKIKKQVEKWIL